MDKKRELLKTIKLFVLDLDGTFYLGDRILPDSLRFIRRVRETGRRFVFFTNNSSCTPDRYVKKITSMGLPVTRADIVTSGDVTIDYLQRYHADASVYLMGTKELREDFAMAGIRLVGEGKGCNTLTAEDALVDSERADVVVAAFDMELTYEKLERACTFIRNGAVFLATHEDINCPTETGFIPDCGAFCAAMTLSTGCEPKYLGKPHAEAVEKVLTLTGIPREEIAFVGDRLYTDVSAGVKNGATGLLVFSGETKPEDLVSSPVAPDAVFEGLGEISDLL